MAETVGIAAASITFAEATLKVSRLISEIKDAPAELLAMNNEISDLRLLVYQVQAISHRDKDLQTLLLIPLRNATNRANAASAFVDSIYQRSVLFKTEWVRKQRKARLLQSDLRDARLQVNAALSASNVQSFPQLHLALEFAAKQQIQTMLDMQATLAMLHSRSVNQSDQLNNISQQVQVSCEANYAQAQRFVASSEQCTTEMPKPGFGHFYGGGQVGNDLNPAESYVAVPLCGRFHRLQSFALHSHPLVDVLGRLFIGYSKFPKFPMSSTPGIQACATDGFSIDVTYFFPNWMLQKAMCFTLCSDLYQSPYLSITTRNVLPRYCAWFNAARYNDCELMALLIKQCPRRINDIDVAGRNALYLAMKYSSFECVELLSQHGAIVTERNSQLSAADMARIMSSTQHGYNERLPSTIRNSIYVHHPEGMPLAHKSLLNLIPLNLQHILDQHPNVINEADENGRTPLWWAAVTNNLESMEVLLSYGARADLADGNGQDPLSAVRIHPFSRGPKTARRINEIVKLLMSQPINLKQKTIYSESAVHVSYHIHDMGIRQKFLRECIDKGVDLNTRVWYSGGALSQLALNVDLTEQEIRMLVEAGMDINSKEDDGETPVSSAMYNGHENVLRRLLFLGADHTAKNNSGYTLLHHAACCGDANVMRTLQQHGLPGVDPNACNSFGATASDLFEERWESCSLSTELRPEFYSLLRTVQFPNCSEGYFGSQRGKYDEFADFAGHDHNRKSLKTYNSDHEEEKDDDSMDECDDQEDNGAHRNNQNHRVFESHVRWSFTLY